MKMRINYIFFLSLFIGSIIGAIIALPYGLFIASTPYYFSWPFGTFWELYFCIVFIMAVIFSLVYSYYGVSWMVLIGSKSIVFHRIVRKKIKIDIKSILELEVLTKYFPIDKKPWATAHLIITLSTGEKAIILLMPHKIITEIKRKVLKLNPMIKINEYDGELSKEDFEKYVLGKK